MKRVLILMILRRILEISGYVYLTILLVIYQKILGSLLPVCIFIYGLSGGFLIISTIFGFVTLDGMYHSYLPVGERFQEDDGLLPFTFVGRRASLYNKIDAFNLMPIKNYFKSFWGY